MYSYFLVNHNSNITIIGDNNDNIVIIEVVIILVIILVLMLAEALSINNDLIETDVK